LLQFPRLNMGDQVELFGHVRALMSAEMGAEMASRHISAALFAICFGSNDYITSFFGNPFGRSQAQKLFTPQAFIRHLIAAYQRHLLVNYF
jgi:hypothetical protein